MVHTITQGRINWFVRLGHSTVTGLTVSWLLIVRIISEWSYTGSQHRHGHQYGLFNTTHFSQTSFSERPAAMDKRS